MLGVKNRRKREAADSTEVTAGSGISETSGCSSSFVRPPRNPPFFSVPSVSLW